MRRVFNSKIKELNKFIKKNDIGSYDSSDLSQFMPKRSSEDREGYSYKPMHYFNFDDPDLIVNENFFDNKTVQLRMKKFELDKTSLSQFMHDFIIRAELARSLKRTQTKCAHGSAYDDMINDPIEYLRCITKENSVSRQVLDSMLENMPSLRQRKCDQQT